MCETADSLRKEVSLVCETEALRKEAFLRGSSQISMMIGRFDFSHETNQGEVKP